MGERGKGKRLRRINKERTVIKAPQRTCASALSLLNALVSCRHNNVLFLSNCAVHGAEHSKGGRLRGWCSFRLCNKWECGTPAVRLSSAPINTSPVFPVTPIIIITIRRNDMLFGLCRRSRADWWHMTFPWRQRVETALCPVIMNSCLPVLFGSHYRHQFGVVIGGLLKRWKISSGVGDHDCAIILKLWKRSGWRANVWD